MAEPAVLDAPAAPAAPAATPAIRVSAMPAPAAPITPPKPGSARERLFSDLRSKATTPGSPAQQPAPQEPSPEPATPEPQPGQVPTEPPEKPGEAPTSPEAPPGAPAPEKGKKTSPWKLVDQWKGRATQLETELAEIKSKTVPESDRATLDTRMKELEGRNKVLEDEIRYVNYTQSQEYQAKYQVPYDTAWKRAMSELGELAITDEATGNSRAIAPQDMLNLLNMSLPEARQHAVQLFGDFADDVMAHRKEIRARFEEMNSALEENKKTGAERDKTLAEQRRRNGDEMAKFIKNHWDTANTEAAADAKVGKYFKPVEGDPEGNQRLAKGFELVDRAFTESPTADGLTPEQRVSIVRRHSAVRNRAAAAGRLIYWNQKLESELAEAKAELAKYKASTPGSTPENGNAPPAAAPAGARASVMDALRKLAVNR